MIEINKPYCLLFKENYEFKLYLLLNKKVWT